MRTKRRRAGRLVHTELTTTLAAVLIACPLAGQEPVTFRACYVPVVGAIYLLDLPGLPDACLSATHEEVVWREGEAPPPASVGTIQLAPEAVTAAKIAPGAVDGSRVARGSIGATQLAIGLERREEEVVLFALTTLQHSMTCTDPDAEVLSGGYAPPPTSGPADEPDVLISRSFPSDARTWSFEIRGTSPVPFDVAFYIVCADVEG